MSFVPTYEKVTEYIFEQFGQSFDTSEISNKIFCESFCGEVEELAFLEELKKIKPVGSFSYKGYKVPVFIGKNFKGQAVEKGKIQFDVCLNAFLLLSGIQEYCGDQKDSEGRFLYEASLQYLYDFVGVPVVNIYFELVAATLEANGLSCKEKLWEEPIIFTHDIDQIRSGWLEDIIHHIKKPSIRTIVEVPKSILMKSFALKDSYYKGLEKMLEIDRKNGLKAISFLMAKKSHQDADYELKKLKEKQQFNRQVIGFHPGYSTCCDEQEFEKQYQQLKQLYPETKPVVRQHFLKYDVQHTLGIQENLGIRKDYSLGFAQQWGFRNSIASPFNLYNFKENRTGKVLQIPLFFMDGTLTEYKNNSSQQLKDKIIREMSKLLTNFNCSFSILFHNSAFTGSKYKGFDEMYQRIVDLYHERRKSN